MPAQPSWFPRLPEILRELRALPNVLYLDRQAFERLFRIKDRRARTLMARFAGQQLGNAWVVERQFLIRALEQIAEGEEFRWEQKRRERVAAVYDRAKREHPARQVEITVKPSSQFQTFASLPPTIQLAPGELRVQFDGFEDLLRKLFELGEAIQNDFAEFQEFLKTTNRLK